MFLGIQCNYIATNIRSGDLKVKLLLLTFLKIKMIGFEEKLKCQTVNLSQKKNPLMLEILLMYVKNCWKKNLAEFAFSSLHENVSFTRKIIHSPSQQTNTVFTVDQVS